MKKSILLVSMPGYFPHYPNIALGYLQAYIKEKSEHSVKTIHLHRLFYEQLGSDFYSTMYQRPNLSEYFSSKLLFNEYHLNNEKIINDFYLTEVPKYYKFLKEDTTFKLNLYFDQYKSLLENVLSKININNYDVVGFSLQFSQTISSLLFAKWIKEQYNKYIIFGGLACWNENKEIILKNFDFVDCVVSGDGEEVLLKLLNSDFTKKSLSLINNISYSIDHNIYSNPDKNNTNLDKLYTPDYDDYYDILNEHPEDPDTIPIISGKGCSWNRCTFCNNPVFQGWSRERDIELLIIDIKKLSKKYKSLHFIFADNELTRKERINQLCDYLIESKIDINIIAEIRCSSLTRQLLKKMKIAGFKNIQLGIESFSKKILNKRIKKGVSVIKNIEVIKNCAEFQIPLIYCLITNYPGEEVKEVEEVYSILQIISHLNSNNFIHLSTFGLNYKTFIYNNPDEYGIYNITREPHFTINFPDIISSTMIFPEYCYEEKRDKDSIKKCQAIWKEIERTLQNKSSILEYQEGEDYLIINDNRFDNQFKKIYLEKNEKKVLLFCNELQSYKDISEHFLSYMQQEELDCILKDLTENYLLYSDTTYYLNLCLPADKDIKFAKLLLN